MNRVFAGAVAGLLAVLAFPIGPYAGEGAEAAAPAAVAAQEIVIGISVRSFHRAYPAELFSKRRVVNDVIGTMEVAVFHDPQSGVSAAWFRMVRGEPIEFSGAAAGTVADDLTTITRWDLATGVAVSGNLQGQRLVPLPVTMTSWAVWAATHPNAQLYRDGR